MGSDVDFFRVPGLENPAGCLYMTGNPPEPTAAILRFAIISGLIVLVAVALLQGQLGRLMRAAGGPLPAWLRGVLRVNLVVAFFLTWELLVSR